MEDIVFPATLQSVSDHCFSICASLRKAIIPRNVTRIGAGAFSCCENLKEVIIPEGVEKTDAPVLQEQQAEALVEITGNRTISNNVFKVNYRQLRPFSAENATCYFVAADGSLISNKRKLLNGEVGAEATVGFVLASGIDYTQMKSCTLRIEVDGTIVDAIDFKMNVSFYSDF